MEKIFDSHSHYNDKSFRGDLDRVLRHIQREGVGYAVNVGYDLESSKQALEMARANDFMYCAVGIHPDSAPDALDDGVMNELRILAQNERTVAIGESGLDYHYDDSPDREIQKQAFIRHIELANEVGKPLIIHTRDAMKDTIDILTRHPLNSGVIHCYSGSRESAKQLVNMGFYIGFTGVITFKNARRALESMKVVPKDRLLIETDCPYMAPEPFRGKRCDSSLLNYTIQKMADELNMTKEEAIEMTAENAKRLFKIK